MYKFSITIAPSENIYSLKEGLGFEFCHSCNVCEFNITIATLNNKDPEKINNNKLKA